MHASHVYEPEPWQGVEHLQRPFDLRQGASMVSILPALQGSPSSSVSLFSLPCKALAEALQDLHSCKLPSPLTARTMFHHASPFLTGVKRVLDVILIDACS